MIYQIPASTFWTLVEGEAINGLSAALERYSDAVGVVRYENQALDSCYGDIFMPFGPSNILKSLDDAERTKPRWSHKAVTWCPSDELKANQPPPYVKPKPKVKPVKNKDEISSKGVELAKQMVEHYKNLKARPVFVRFSKNSTYGIFYDDSLMLIGEKPDKKYFSFNGDDWYLACYYMGCEEWEDYDKYHPFGYNFMLKKDDAGVLENNKARYELVVDFLD